MIARLALAAATPVAVLVAAGCGAAGGSGSADPVSVAPPDSLVFAEGTIRPTGELKEDADAISRLVTGDDEFGAFIVSKLEEASADRGEPVDFKAEVAPWLGPLAGVYAGRFDGEDFSRGGVVLQSTDRAAARGFLDRQAERGDHPADDRSYRGVNFEVGADSAFGLIGDLVVFADGAAAFREAVDASEGESLSGEARYEDAIADAADGSIADIYLDLGRMTGQFQALFGSQALGLLALATIDPGTTMMASVVPREGTLEVDVSGSFDATVPGGGASDAIEGLPGDAIAAAGIPGFGRRLETAIDGLDSSGIKGEVGPGELKSALRAAGIDPEAVASNLGDAGVFAEETGGGGVGGALLISAESPRQARRTVSDLGLFLRRTGTPGVTAVSGAATGFSVRDPEQLGKRPLVVAAAGPRIAIGYGLAPALRGLSTETDPLSGSPAFAEAVAALGQTPINAFVDGPAALRLASDTTGGRSLRKARPYLEKVSSVGIGSAGEGDSAKTVMIFSFR